MTVAAERPESPAPDPPRYPWWAAFVAVVSVIAVVATVGAAVTAGLTLLVTRNLSGDFVTEGRVDTVSVALASGSVELHADPDADRVEVRWALTTSVREATVVTEQTASGLRISAECPAEGWRRLRCDSMVDVTVPPDVELDIDVETGQILIRDMSGRIDATIGTGAIVGTRLGSTDVDASGNTGSVDLTFVTPPTQVRGTVNVGEVVVHVPEDGTTYQVSAATNVAPEVIDLPEDAASTRTLIATSNVGQVTLRAGEDPPAQGPRPGQ